jgi:hypothetical protein
MKIGIPALQRANNNNEIAKLEPLSKRESSIEGWLYTGLSLAVIFATFYKADN